MSVIPSLPFSPVLLPICPWFTQRMYGSGLLSTPWWIHSYSFFFFVLPELLLSAIICSLCHYIKEMMSEVQVFIKQLWVHNCQKSPDQRIHQPSNSSIITHGVTWVSFTSSNSIRSSLRAEANYSPTSTTMSCTIMDMHIYQGLPRWFSGKEPAY